jgi:hypothetical protein
VGSMTNLRCKNPEPLMSALGQKRTFTHLRPMSALPPKADIAESDWHVRFVPKADIPSRADRLDSLARSVALRSAPITTFGRRLVGCSER